MSWWVDRQNKDKFVKKRQEMNYISRSYFKIEEINLKYKILWKNSFVLDLGACPGGWCQYFLKFTKNIVAIDILNNFQLVDKNIIFLQENINNLENIKSFLQNKKFNLIVSDIAPNLSGNLLVDSSRMFEIFQSIFTITTIYLDNNGFFVFKFFKGEYVSEVTKILHKFFKKIFTFKPKSSRKESKEFYFVCTINS